MKRRNLIGSLLAGIGVMFTRSPLAAASGAPSGAKLDAPSGAKLDAPGGAMPGQSGSSPRATVRVIFADTAQSSWEAVTDGGILVAGATGVTPGNVRLGNLLIIHDAIKAIAAAGGPVLTHQQVALFGGQT